MCRAVLTVLTTRASTQVNKDQPLCRKNRSISCLISESLLMKNNSKYLKCVSILEGDDANCQIEKGDFIIDVAGIHSLARRYPALGECHRFYSIAPLPSSNSPSGRVILISDAAHAPPPMPPWRLRTPALWPTHSLDWVSTRRIPIASRVSSSAIRPANGRSTVKKGW
jgi:hypothetical protein